MKEYISVIAVIYSRPLFDFERWGGRAAKITAKACGGVVASGKFASPPSCAPNDFATPLP